MRQRPDRAIQAVSKMPPLDHYPNRPEPFDIRKSEVVNWIIEQPEVRRWLFTRFEDYLRFNPETRKWTGRNYTP